MSIDWYPLIFEPILKDRIWGGSKLQTVLNKKVQTQTTGESWEISTVINDVSIVCNGDFYGESLAEIINKYPKEILGDKVFEQYGNQFPLLFKFLDAKDDLSIQVHPNNALAKKRHNSLGKTEMWYIMQANLGAKIIVGFKEDTSASAFLKHLENKTLVTILEEIEVKQGDVFFLETGTIHAIGAGIMLAEIQQTSDITYRVYDWDRKDVCGKERELHIDLALEAINYNKIESKKRYNTNVNVSNNVVNCPFFTTNFIPLDGEMIFKNKEKSFKVLMCTEGAFDLQYNNTKITLTKGQTILIPAVITDYILIGKASVLEIYVS